MENIHTPSVPSGPKTEQGSWNAVKQDKLSLIDLISEKQRVEGELSALSSVLDSVGNEALLFELLGMILISAVLLAWSKHEYKSHHFRRFPKG